MDHSHVSYISHTIVLLMQKCLEVLFPCTARMLGIHSCDVFMSYMWYTKQILFCAYPCYGLVEMLSSSDPPLYPLWVDMSSDIGFLPFVRLHAEPFPEFGTSIVFISILNVVAVNSQIDVYVAYMS